MINFIATIMIIMSLSVINKNVMIMKLIIIIMIVNGNWSIIMM